MSALMGVLLLTLVATMTLFVAEPDLAYAQAASGNADLQRLVVEGSPDDADTGDLLPSSGDGVFGAATTMYTVRIPHVDSGVDITATAEINLTGGDQTIKVNGTTVTSGAAHTVTGIASGTITTINIEVTAPAGNKKVYTVKVYRERSPLSDNANLSSLGLAGVRLSPAFSSGTISYEARVQATEVTVSYRLSDTAGGASAAITVEGGGTDDDDTTDMTFPLGDEAEIYNHHGDRERGSPRPGWHSRCKKHTRFVFIIFAPIPILTRICQGP